ncbi:MAG: hypothetical protein IPP71_09830 [Bacteroidetes bacterium]|nr:hypothetical protein [Bacteroidota bacterium]
MQCENGHIFHQQAGKLRNAEKWCSKCRDLNIQNAILKNYKKWAIENGFKILTNSVKENISTTHLEWQCSKGHLWSATAAKMKIKNSCSACTKEDVRKSYLEQIRKIAISKGGKCVSDEYLNNYTHLEFRCKMGHVFFANANNIKTGYWCAHCSGNAKLTIDIFKELAISHGGQLISKEYIGIDHSLNWKCKEGHAFHLTGYSVKNNNNWCPHCKAGKILTRVQVGEHEHYVYNIEDMHKLAKASGGVCLSSKYLGGTTKLKWECAEGHKWLAQPYKIRFGTWCKICRNQQKGKASRLPLTDIEEIVADKSGKILSSEKNYYLSYPLVQLKCMKGHVWETNIKYIKYGSWCPKCKFDAVGLRARIPFSHYEKLVKRKGAKLLTHEEDYQNGRSRLTIKCKKGHVFEKAAGQLNEGSWCVECG